MADSGFIKVAQVSELKTGEMMAVTIGDDQVLLNSLASRLEHNALPSVLLLE